MGEPLVVVLEKHHFFLLVVLYFSRLGRDPCCDLSAAVDFPDRNGIRNTFGFHRDLIDEPIDRRHFPHFRAETHGEKEPTDQKRCQHIKNLFHDVSPSIEKVLSSTFSSTSESKYSNLFCINSKYLSLKSISSNFTLSGSINATKRGHINKKTIKGKIAFNFSNIDIIFSPPPSRNAFRES